MVEGRRTVMQEGAERAFFGLLILLICVSVAAAGWQVVQRVEVEEANKRVELVADYTDFAAFARQEGWEPAALFAALRRAGITSVGLPEWTIEDLEREGWVASATGFELLAAQRLGRGTLPLPDDALRPDELYLFVGDPAVEGWLGRSLLESFGSERVRRVREVGARGGNVFAVRGDFEALRETGIGFPPGVAEELAKSGLHVIPRPSNSPHLSAAGIQGLIEDGAVDGNSTLVLFAGEEKVALGYPDHLRATADALRQHGLNLAVIETPEQLGNVNWKGIRDLDRLLDGRAVRLFSLPDWIISRRSPDEVIDTVVRAVEERNIRAVYLRPLDKGIAPDHLVDGNLAAIHGMADGLIDRGFSLGPAEPFATLTVPFAVRLAIAIGLVAAGLICLPFLLPVPLLPRFLLLVVGSPGSAALLAVAPNLGPLAVAFGVAVIFPALGYLVLLRRWRGAWRRSAEPGLAALWGEGAIALLLVSGIALLGGVLIGGLLGETRFLVEWEFFRGVKLSLIAPPLLIGLFFLATVGVSGGAPGERGLLRGAFDLGEETVRFKHLLVLTILAAALVLLLIRSGNAGGEFIADYELQMRRFLENFLIARPRTKEFLFGHPALFLAPLLLWYRERLTLLILLIAASVGSVSIVNSFEHLRTPFLVSLWRTANGITLGLLVGSILLPPAWWVLRWFERLRAGWRVGGPAAGAGRDGGSGRPVDGGAP